MNLKTLADWGHRQFRIMLAADEDGMVRCFISGKKYPIDKIQLAHYKDRSCNALRYHMKNTQLISKKSNVFDANEYIDGESIHHRDFRLKLIEVFGEDVIPWLDLKSQKIEQLTHYELEQKIKGYLLAIKQEMDHNKNMHPSVIKSLKKYLNASKEIVST